MASRAILYLSFFALCALVAMVTLADAEDAEANTDLQRGVKRRSLEEVLHLERRAAGDKEATGKGRQGRRRKGRGKGKGKGRGKGKGTPIYERCVNPDNGLTCTCDMRFEKFRDHPTKRMKFYKIC